MSRWNDWGWYTPAPKKPPPKRGIKMKKSGATWWGRRWVEALERISSGYSNRLARGRTYARAGRTHDLVIKEGKVTAKVTGSRSTPYKVTIQLGRFPDAVWNKAIAAMAKQAQFSAELLAGQMPQAIDAAFHDAGASLFPTTETDLSTNCSCPDWANPCKHVAATHYVLGEAFDRDPFLLFELRGRSKAQVLEALRAARAGKAEPSASRHQSARDKRAVPEIPSVKLGRIQQGDWDKPPAPLPTLRLSFETPPASGAVLQQLGPPTGWTSQTSPVELLGPTIRAAAQRARAMALAEPATAPETPPEPVATNSARVGGKVKAKKTRPTRKKATRKVGRGRAR